MKRLLAGVAVVSVVLGACSGGGDQEPAAESGQPRRIGFSDPVSAQPIDKAMGEAMVAAGENANMDVSILDAALDANKQVSDLDQFIAQEMDGIVVFPLAPDSVTPPIERAREQGIKVVGASAVLSETEDVADVEPYDAAFNQSADVVGARLLANYVGENLDGSGRVLGIGIAAPVPSIQFMVENYEKYLLESYPEMEWLDTVGNPTDDITGGERVVEEAIARFGGDIDAVMAYNTASALGAAAALERAGLTDVLIVGQNGDPEGAAAVEEGQIDAMVDLVPWRQGLMAVEIMRRLLDGEDVPSLVFSVPELYTAENIDDRLDWDEAIEQIRSGELDCESGGCPEALLD